MEPLDSDFITQTDIMNTDKIKCRTPSPATSYAGSDRSISKSKVVSATEATVHERNDVMLRLMGHLIPGVTEPEEASGGETDNSIVSSPSTLKRRLHDLPASNDAVKLADRTASLNRRIRRERDLYLHLQGVTNRIEEKDETDLSTTDSSRTVNSIPNRHRQGQNSNPRARRRERLYSVSSMSQHQTSSDLQLCSPGLSSPEPLTLREIPEGFTKELGKLSFPIKDEYSFENEESQNSSNPNFSAPTNDADDAESQNHERISGFDFDDVDYFGKSLSICNVASERVHDVAPLNASSTGLDYTYVTQKRTPMQFGGYRPAPGLIFRNLSSDSESDAPLDRISYKRIHEQNFRKGEITDLEIHDEKEEDLPDSDFVLNSSCPDLDGRIEIESFSDERIEILKGRCLSPIPSADSKLFFEDSKLSEKLDTDLELRNPHEPWKNSDDVDNSASKPVSKIPGNSNQQSVPASARSVMDLKIGNRDDENSVFDRASNISIANSVHQQSEDDFVGRNECLKIPPLEIESHGFNSQSHSLSSEGKIETSKSSLDVNALIRALSDVSLKQENSTNRYDQSTLKLKSPFGYGNRFSESSGPRSSEYTPAAGGSRQSLTSLEVSESRSVKIYNNNPELMLRRQAYTPSQKSNERSARSTSRTPEILKNESMHCEKVALDVNLSQGGSFIPVVAKVNRTNLVCPKHPLRIKSIGKLISPRKYPNIDFADEISKPLTSRTDVSQSSEGSRRSFRSLKSVKLIENVRETKIDGLRTKIVSPGLLAPLSAGRRILEPLNLVPKIQPHLLNSLNHRSERCKKSEIINNQTEKTHGNSSRRSPLTRTNRTDLCFAHSQEGECTATNYTEVLSGRITSSREQFDNSSRVSTAGSKKLLENSIRSEKYSRILSGRSSVTSDKVLSHLSERLSMSSGEGKNSWSPSPRDEASAGNDDTYDSEDKLNNQQRRVENSQDMRLSDFGTNLVSRSFGNCVYLNDLQDGREVTLSCGIAKCQEESLREKELFKHLPDEISSSLTRNTSFGSQTTKNLNSNKEVPSTIEDLRRNIQENNDQWIKDFRNNEYVRDSISELSDSKISSTSSPVQFTNFQSLRNVTKIPEEIPPVNLDSYRSPLPVLKTVETEESSCSKSCLSSKIDPESSECSSPLYADIRQELDYNNSESCDLDSQRTSVMHSGYNSRQNTHRSIPESTDFTNVLEFDEEFDNCSFEKGEKANSANKKGIDEWKDNPEAPFSVHPSESISNVSDEHGHSNILDSSIEEKSISEDDEEAVEAIPSKIPSDKVPNSQSHYLQSQLKTVNDYNKDRDEKNQFVNESEDHETPNRPSMNCEKDEHPAKCNANGFGVCEKRSSPSSTRSAKSQGVTQHHQDTIVSSPVSIKSFISMSKLNSYADPKRDANIAVPCTSSVKKSQDRFPFTISESASRKTSKYKFVTDMSLEQLIQDQNSHAEHNDTILLEKCGNQEITTINDNEYKINTCYETPIRQSTPFLEEFPNEMSNDSPDNLEAKIPVFGTNYISYGCREETRNFIPTMKEIVKKFSAKLRHSKTKRRHDDQPEETNIEILYRNKKCRMESTEGSSSIVSLYQSPVFDTSSKLLSGLAKTSNDGSRVSSGKKVEPKRNIGCTSMDMQQQSSDKGNDRNDLWIQEFDSDVEFDAQTSTEACNCKVLDDSKIETMPRTSSPFKDRYSMFLARRKLSGIIDEADHNELIKTKSFSDYCEGGDNERVNCKGPDNVRTLFNELEEIVSKPPKTPANSCCDDNNINKFETKANNEGDSSEDSPVKTGCCFLRIYRYFATYRKLRSKPKQEVKVSKKK